MQFGHQRELLEGYVFFFFFFDMVLLEQGTTINDLGGAEKIETKNFEGHSPGIKKSQRPFSRKKKSQRPFFPRKKKSFHKGKKFASDIFSATPRSLMVDPKILIFLFFLMKLWKFIYRLKCLYRVLLLYQYSKRNMYMFHT